MNRLTPLTTYLEKLPFNNENYFIDTLTISKTLFIKTFLESNLEFDKSRYLSVALLQELLTYDFVTDDGDNIIIDLEMLGGRS